MKQRILPFTIIILTIISSCSPKIRSAINNSRQPLAYDSEVLVLTMGKVVPKDVIAIGDLSIGDTGFSVNCNYDKVLAHAKLKARENGANIVKITEHKTPNLASSCHRIRAKLYYAEDLGSISPQDDGPLVENLDHALLHVYRYPGVGPLISYNLQLGDSTICRIKNNYKAVIKIKKEGKNTLWAKTESKEEAPIDIVHGKSYYLRCGLTMGAFVGRPTMELVDYRTGKQEFEAFEAKHSNNQKD